MARKLNKREQAVLDYLRKNANRLNGEYVSALERNLASKDWYLGHAAEANNIFSDVRKILEA